MNPAQIPTRESLPQQILRTTSTAPSGDILTRLHKHTTYIFAPTPDSPPKYLPQRLLVGRTGNSHIWAALQTTGSSNSFPAPVHYYYEGMQNGNVFRIASGDVLGAVNLGTFACIAELGKMNGKMQDELGESNEKEVLGALGLWVAFVFVITGVWEVRGDAEAMDNEVEGRWRDVLKALSEGSGKIEQNRWDETWPARTFCGDEFVFLEHPKMELRKVGKPLEEDVLNIVENSNHAQAGSVSSVARIGKRRKRPWGPIRRPPGFPVRASRVRDAQNPVSGLGVEEIGSAAVSPKSPMLRGARMPTGDAEETLYISDDESEIVPIASSSSPVRLSSPPPIQPLGIYDLTPSQLRVELALVLERELALWDAMLMQQAILEKPDDPEDQGFKEAEYKHRQLKVAIRLQRERRILLRGFLEGNEGAQV